MVGKLRCWVLLTLTWLLCAPAALAQPGAMPPPGTGPGGPGGDPLESQLNQLAPDLPVAGLVAAGVLVIVYLLVMLPAYVGLFLIWVSSSDWVNQDRFFRRESKNWNLAMFLPFAICFPVTAFIFCNPLISISTFSVSFWIGFPIQLLAWLIPFVIYVAKRNPQMQPDDKVFTKQHIRRWTSAKLQKIGIKTRSEEMTIDDIGPPLKLSGRGGATDRDNTAHLLMARQAPGYVPARELLAQGLDNRAGAVMLDYTQQAVAVRMQVDGVWHPGENLEREPGDALLAVLKLLASRNPNERRARQQGKFGVEYRDYKNECRLMSQGTQTGERVLIQFEDPSVKKKRPLDLGMRPKMFEDLQPVLNSHAGMVVVSAPAGGGLTSLLHAIVASMDRYTRGFVDVEDAATKEVEVENVNVTTFNGAAGETPLTVLPKLLREYPDVLVVPDMKDAETVDLLCDQTGLDRTVVTTVRAKEASEALLRLLEYKAPREKLAAALKVVVNMRLVRKLCDKCKEAYAPPPQLLEQLRIPPGRVEALYRPPTPNPEQPQEPCRQCRGIGYFGRTGIFEVLVVNEQVREALIKKPKLDVLRQAARQAGMRTLQEDGLLLAITGGTSLPELMRALKEA
ncbi:MAG TPA: ATPase, T2SS/T4P/T4SS family [Pirellulales bacterium]|nr:ATPase, T2SS/T4P/T4SS family [Pirellulales bacterium]